MLQRNNSQTCYAETPSGKFTVRCIQKMLKIHEMKNIKAAVEREIIWFLEDYTTPQTVSENPPATAIMSFQKMLYSSKYDEAIRPHGITPTELSMICDNRWLSDDHITWLMKKLTDSGTDTYCIYLNGVLNTNPMGFRRLCCRDNLPSKILFSINVGVSGTGDTYFGTDHKPGCHWTMCYIDTIQKKIIYGDSMAWNYPKSLPEKANMYIKAISPNDDVANYTIVTCHDPSSTASGTHCCNENCANFYPFQTCGSICGVVVMVMAAIACHNPAYFCYLSTRHSQDLPNVFLQTPSRYSKYLRFVIASWIAENSVNTFYIIPVQDENSINVAGGKQEETSRNSKTCTRPEDTAQKIPTNSNGKHNSSSFLKDSKLKTGPQCQPSTEEISKECNASTDDKEDACNSTSSQSSMPKKKAEFQPEKLNEKKKFQCNHCPSCFTTNFSFRRHMQSQHPTATAELEGKSKCNHCGFKCHRIGDLGTHLSQKHNAIFEIESITLNNINGKSIIIINFSSHLCLILHRNLLLLHLFCCDLGISSRQFM